MFIWHRIGSSEGLYFTVADCQVACDVLTGYFSVVNFLRKSVSCSKRICKYNTPPAVQELRFVQEY